MSERSVALKAMRLSSEFRTNLELMRRSKRVSQDMVRRAEIQCVDYLARTNLIYPPCFTSLGLFEGMPLPERKWLLGIELRRDEVTTEELEFQDMLATGAKKSLKANWIWRIGQEAHEKCLEGWYGFFVTLTVDPSRVPDSLAMWQDGREFRKYIHRLATVAAKACGMPRALKDGASDRDFVHHVGVIEHGKSRHHHHMHLLIWMRDIPASWKKCPNAKIRDPRYRTNDWSRHMGTYWPHALPGIGKAKYFRHEGDAWSRLGFVLPWDSKKQRTVRIHSPEKAGLYIAKYMDKDDKVWLHRIKATRNLGLTRLKKVLFQMDYRKVEALTWRPRSYSLSTTMTTIHSVPPGLLRLMAKQESFCRKWAMNTLDFRMLLQPNSDSFSEMLKSVRDGARPKRMRSKAFYEWVSRHLPVPKGYSEDKLRRAGTSLGVHFRPIPTTVINHVGIT